MISQKETADRIEYILKHVKLGLSRIEVQNRFQLKYQCGATQTRIWYCRAIDTLIVVDKIEKPRVRAVLLEVLHSHLVGFNQDIAKISDRLAKMDADNDRRSMIEEQLLIVTDEKQVKALTKELRAVSDHPVKSYLEAIECRSKTRDRIIKCCAEIGRLHGLYIEEMPLTKAIQVMAQSEMIPAKTAGDLLDLITNFERNIDRLVTPSNGDSLN